jgi:hypothetical protein
MPLLRFAWVLMLAGLVLPLPAHAADILQRLRDVPGLEVAETTPPRSSVRTFLLHYTQPVDHARPTGPAFRQRMTLIHQSESAPLVLSSTGYSINPRPVRRELTRLLRANQLEIEHRYFGTSVPVPTPWEYLTIAQAAEDHHRIVQALRPVYSGKWVSTGVSKGGMTSVYHRYFYPDDVDATVPYVAPSSQGPSDVRYVHFLEQVGSADCRERLREFQKAALQHFDELLGLLDEYYVAYGVTFNALGKERALEYAILESPFYFWQYSGDFLCAYIPGPDASAQELFWFVEVTSEFDSFFSDRALSGFAPYYYQAATELGGPRYDERHLHGLLRYPHSNAPAVYPPSGVEKPFDASVMSQVERWVRTDGQRMLFIYGENDPWSATAFVVREGNDSYRLYEPGGNHAASISGLSAGEQAFVMERLSQWLEVPVQGLAAEAEEELPFEHLVRQERTPL